MTGIWPDWRVEELKKRWQVGESMSDIARAMGTTRNAIIGKSNRLNLQFHSGAARQFSPTAPSVTQGRTRYPGMVRLAGNGGVLKPGAFNRKLGSVITKGRWKAFPVYALTLEERATCPRSCKIWVNCYGNGSHGAIRYQAGELLMRALLVDLGRLQRIHPDGFAVRLHSLGDFFSVDYVEFWRRALVAFQGLRVFGYTARQADDPIGAAVAALRDMDWNRFAIRTSGAPEGPRTAIIRKASEAAAGAIICPAQLSKTASCSSCALCWAHPAKDRVIAFLQH